MEPQNLINMANHIGSFFEAMPDRTEARDGVATHIRKFWEPRMRRQILKALDSPHSAELSVLVSEALHHYRAMLQPPDDAPLFPDSPTNLPPATGAATG